MAQKVVQSEGTVIPSIESKRVTITIEGISPLICHNFSQSQRNQILDKQMKKAQKAKEAKDPEKDYKESMYLDKDGNPGFPSSGIKKACVDACSFIEGVTKVQARGSFFIMGDILPINGEPEMLESVVRLNGRSADIRYRALFHKWSIDLPILFNPRVISVDGIANLLENAGFSIGIGDWRPQKSGAYGMFSVKRG